uniref:BRCA1-A complex subunit RAP80 isoform X2 n=1 Tax=Jaculus jaculus TaxID=51337 RepID=UPI0003332537|nr:BRCA1-A complex subunit RAP80 isoform X2 [Jaculus jaculus]
MPRRKKKIKEVSNCQNLDKKDAESTTTVSVKKKRRLEDSFIVISDSDGEEPKEENGLQKMKTKQSSRAKCLARRKISQMTEEEQFALALKMSEQEAREVNSQEEKEEELFRKAIAESLNSCCPSAASATRSRPLATGPCSHSHQEETTDSGTTEGILQLVPPPLFEGSPISQGNEAEEKKEPWDYNENIEEEPGNWDQSNQPLFENENAKCFDRCTGHLAEHKQCAKPQEITRRSWSFLQPAQGSGGTSRQCLSTPADAKGLQDVGGAVHYYWGIPFCPAGIDPNQYTSVILCQLEVYQKSLKMAQRQLFKKRRFGEPVLPSPPLIQNECGQEDETSENNESISEDVGDEDKEDRHETRESLWHSQSKDLQEKPVKRSKQKLMLEEEPTTSHGQSSQGLFVEETSEEVMKSSEEGNSVPVLQSIAALTSKGSLVLVPEKSTEEITVCPETQLSSPETLDLEREDSPHGRDSSDEVQVIMRDEINNREDGKKENPSAFSSSTQVSCPLCNQGFPLTKIEQHAMYCSGPTEQRTVLTQRRREAKKKNDSRTAAQTSLDSDKNEKCYLCKSLVPLREYQCHVDNCIQLARADPGDGRGRVHPSMEGKQLQRRRNPKEKGHNEGRLLNLLEQSEHKTTGAEIKTRSSEAGAFGLPSPRVEEAGCSREVQSSLAQLDFTESPIKSFVSISEVTDCLVDFKKQLAVRPGGRTRTKAGRRKRRKS